MDLNNELAYNQMISIISLIRVTILIASRIAALFGLSIFLLLHDFCFKSSVLLDLEKIELKWL
jgi:hypothetical protein